MSPTTWFRLLGLSCLLTAAAFALPALTDGAKKGKKYALLVGVRSYEHRKLTDLKYTENDAEEMASVLTKAKYDEVVVLTTTRGEKSDKAKPTKANIERELKRLLKKVTKHDVVLIGLAGHGVQYEVKQDGKRRDESFFCPADARLLDSDDFKELAATMLPFRELFRRLDDSGAGSRLLLVDACRNDPGSSRNADTDAMPKPTKGTAALFSCKGGERAFESEKLGKGHGVFFYHVIEALKGKAKDEEGDVSWDDLTRHVRRAVVKDVPKLVGGGARQTPHLMANVEGDPVLLKLGKEAVSGEKRKTGPLRVGVIGLDSSHATAFTGVLNKEGNKGPLENMRVVAAFPAGSPDLPLSADRLAGFTRTLREKHKVEMVRSIDVLTEKVDAVLLLSVDGRPHLEQARPVIKAGKAVFIDKPIAASLADTIEIFELAKKHEVPCFSSSSLRFSDKLKGLAKDRSIGKLLSCETTGPVTPLKGHPELFYYGIHGIEMLYTVLGTGCESVTWKGGVVTGTWKGGRVGTFREAKGYKATATGDRGKAESGGGDYQGLVAEIGTFFRTGKPPVPAEETIELVAFMVAAEQSKKAGGKSVTIESVIKAARQEIAARSRKGK